MEVAFFVTEDALKRDAVNERFFDSDYVRITRVIGFKLLTTGPGNYPAQVFTVTDEIRGKADLVIKVVSLR
jgi:hypothetical protein